MLSLRQILSPTRRREREHAFTLVELLIVVGIIVVLAIIAIPVYLGLQQQAKDGALKADVQRVVKQTFIAATAANSGDNTNGYVAYQSGTANPAGPGQIGIKYTSANPNGRIMITNTVPAGTNPVAGSVNGTYLTATHGGPSGYEITGYFTDNSFYFTYNSDTGVFSTGDNPYYTSYAPTWTGASVTSTLPAAIVNQAYSFQFTTLASPDATYTATGLPAGLTLDSATGKLTGTPTTGGSNSLSVTATNPSGSITGAYSLLVQVPPSISTTSLPSGMLGTAYSTPIAASGIAAPTFTATGLPAGLSIDPNSGVISGTPTVRGVFSPTVTATNGAGSANMSYGLVIKDAPQIDPSNNLGNIVVGTAYSYTITATGQPSPTFTATGLPQSFSINPNTGTISGTIQPSDSDYGTGGAYSIKVTATNDSGSTSKTFTGTIYATPVITTTSLPAGTGQSAYSATVAATGTPSAITFSATGLPAGLSMSSAGVISGTPTSGYSGTYTVAITATNTYASANHSSTTNLALFIANATPDTPSNPGGIAVSSYNGSYSTNYSTYAAYVVGQNTNISWNTATCDNNGTPQYHIINNIHNGQGYGGMNGYAATDTNSTSYQANSWVDTTNGQGSEYDYQMMVRCVNSTGASSYSAVDDFKSDHGGGAVYLSIITPGTVTNLTNDGFRGVYWNAPNNAGCPNNTYPIYSPNEEENNGNWWYQWYGWQTGTSVQVNHVPNGQEAFGVDTRCVSNNNSSVVGQENWTSGYYTQWTTSAPSVSGASINNPGDSQSGATSYIYFNGGTGNLNGCSISGQPSGYSVYQSGNTCVVQGSPNQDGNFYVTVTATNEVGSAAYGWNTGTIPNFIQDLHGQTTANWAQGSNLTYAPGNTGGGYSSGSSSSVKADTNAAGSTSTTCNLNGTNYSGLCGHLNYYPQNIASGASYHISACFTATTTSIGTVGFTVNSSNSYAVSGISSSSFGNQWKCVSANWNLNAGDHISFVGANTSTSSIHEWEVSDLTITRN